MAARYRSGGQDLDALFAPYASGTKPSLTGLRVGGQDLRDRYQPLGGGAKRANVGYRVGGSDISNLFSPVGSGSLVLGFDGQGYSALGARTARLELALNFDGTWTVTRTNQTVVTVISSGTWLPSGAAAASYQVQFVVGAHGAGAVSNGASSYVALSTSRTVSLGLNNVSTGPVSDTALITCNLRLGTGTATASSCSFAVDVAGV